MPNLVYIHDPESGRFTFDASRHAYEVRLRARGLPAITLSHDGQILASDRLDLFAAKERARFAARLNGRADVVASELLALAHVLESPVARGTDEDGADGPYQVVDGRICFRKRERDGDVWLPLCNFTARIAREVIADDGVSEQGELLVVGALRDGTALPPVRVRTGKFEGMGWVVGAWGARAVVAAGMGSRDRLREAIQTLSTGVVQEREYVHPGWRHLEDRTWAYLHAGGAIGPEGPVPGVAVRLGEPVGRLVLPTPPEGEELQSAVRASLAILDVAPDSVTAPLLAAAYRAPLQAAHFADVLVFLAGQTGTLKSELTALAQQHFGDGFDRLHLPASWTDTPNSLERKAFDFKDALLVVDDFAPSGTAMEIARYHATADRVLRGAGNAAGRGRMSADGTPRPDLRPRGLLLSSGEDLPKGHSARARAVIVEVRRNDVDLARLTEAQAAAARGKPARAMAGYLRWMAPRMAELGNEVRAEHAGLREQARARGQHARTPGAVAQLGVGWRWWLRYAVEAGSLSEGEADALWQRVWAALTALGAGQAEHQLGEDPVERFPTLLTAAITSGEAYLAAADGGVPSNPAARGWRLHTIGTGEYQRDDWRPLGKQVGWVDGDDLYLQLDAAYGAAQRVGQATGSPLTVQPRTLAKRLHEARLLRSVDPIRGRLLVRKSFCGTRQPFLHLAASVLSDEESAQPAPPTPTGRDGQQDERTDACDVTATGADAASKRQGGPQPSGAPTATPTILGRLGPVGSEVASGATAGTSCADCGSPCSADGMRWCLGCRAAPPLKPEEVHAPRPRTSS